MDARSCLTESDFNALAHSWIPASLAESAGLFRVDSCDGAGGRIIILRGELEVFLAGLPGVTLDEAQANLDRRRP
jgi:hypothetical protein